MTSERGYASIEFAMAVGVILLPIALVVLSFGPWLERRVAAESAAAEGARTAVLELDVSAGSDMLLETTRSSGLADEHVRVGWCGASPASAPTGGCSFARGSAVEIDVEIWAPLFRTPWGEVGGIWVSGNHSEPVDLYRSLD